MSAPDCLAIADYMYNRSEFRRSAQWYRLALSVFKEPQNRIARQFYLPKKKSYEESSL